MALEPLPPFPSSSEPAARPRGPGRVAIAGAVGACVLGSGLGLWARPAPPEPPRVVEAPKPAGPALQVVIDDAPRPAGELLEVLPADLEAGVPPRTIPRLIPVEPLDPRRSAGLVKVDAVVAPVPAPKPVVPAPAAPAPKPAPAPVVRVEKVADPAPRPAKVTVKTEAKPPARPEKAAEKPKPRPPAVRVAKADKAKAEKPPAKKKPAAQLAKAEPKPKAKPRAEAPKRLADAKAAKIKASLKKTLAKADPKPKAGLKKKPKVELAEAKARPKVLKAKAAKPAPKPKVETARVERKPAPRPVVPRGEGPLRVARNDGCASHDPGEALVCADRRLAARDRQMQQAYRDAEAAGVPASALRRQQSRWVQARAAAAREAPWAVEDVYVARISELHDLSRDAREN